MLSGRATGLVDVYPPTAPVDDEPLREALDVALDVGQARILAFIKSPPQTNEVARAAPLAGGFLTVAALTGLPLAIVEVGASAGLNLHWDDYGLDLGGLRVGDSDGLPLLAPTWEGPRPPAVDVTVVERAGCDRAPIDIRSADDILRLRAYVWPDQTDRLTRLDQALAVARSSQVSVERADAVDWAVPRLTNLQTGVATVLFHSIVWQYIPSTSQERLRRIIDGAAGRASAKSPFAWLRMEPETRKAAALSLTLWPSGEMRRLADVDYHGRWVRWYVDADALGGDRRVPRG